MFPVRLVQLIEANADRLSEGLMHKVRNSERSSDFLQRVPPDEVKRRTYEIYRNLSDWLLTKTESEIEERYVGLGMRRARQGVPYSAFLWAVSTTKEYLWDFLRQEGLLEQPVDLFGEIDLLHSLEVFFDRALYFAALGYESVRQAEAEQTAPDHAVSWI